MSLPLTTQQWHCLELIGDHVVHGRTLTLARFGRSTLRALERRGLIRQIGATFSATRRGLEQLGLVTCEMGDL